MYNNQTIAVVVPCFNEEKQISKVIDTMPDFVDRIVIINDGSTDQTEELVKQEIDKGCKGLTLGLKHSRIKRGGGGCPGRCSWKRLCRGCG